MNDRYTPIRSYGLAFGAILALTCNSSSASDLVSIQIDAGQRFQTIIGWEAGAQSGQDDPGFPGWSEHLFDLAVEDLGINRLRLEVKSGVESREHVAALHEITLNPRCRRYFTSNDNDDPRSIDWEGFDFSELDGLVERIIRPMKRRLEARGEKLYVNLEYVAFIAQCKGSFDYVHARTDEYAEFVLAAFLHLREKFDLVPDALEILLEPDNVPGWTGTRIGEAIVAAAVRLAEAGFHPEFIAPGTTSLAAASAYVDEIVTVPGAHDLLKEISYHRYRGVSRRTLEALARRASRLAIRTAMLERIGADVDTLYEDLVYGGVSAWQQFTLAFTGKDNGGKYFCLGGGKVELCSRTRYLRRYFRHVRSGAVRVGTTSDNDAVRVVAFVDSLARPIVVVHVDAPRRLAVSGLARGRYAATLTTANELDVELGPLVVDDSGWARFRVPEQGVLTIYSTVAPTAAAKP